MIRKILCEQCGAFKPSNLDDAAAGWRYRRVAIRARRPAVHGVTVNGEFHPMASIVCDHCATPIADGQAAVALTEWNENREGEPHQWEEEFSG